VVWALWFACVGLLACLAAILYSEGGVRKQQLDELDEDPN